jgi:hypothetical protein
LITYGGYHIQEPLMKFAKLIIERQRSNSEAGLNIFVGDTFVAPRADGKYRHTVWADKPIPENTQLFTAPQHSPIPQGCSICANGSDIPEGEYCRACGFENNMTSLGRAVKMARGGTSVPDRPLKLSAAPSAPIEAQQSVTPLSEYEQKAILSDLAGLESLMDYHFCEETKAEAFAGDGAGNWHRDKALQYRALGIAIINEDPELWHESAKAPFLTGALIPSTQAQKEVK